jgi:hypothetical protein
MQEHKAEGAVSTRVAPDNRQHSHNPDQSTLPRLFYLVDAITTFALDAIMGFPSPLELVKSSAGIERLTVQDIDTRQIKRLCCLVRF